MVPVKQSYFVQGYHQWIMSISSHVRILCKFLFCWSSFLVLFLNEPFMKVYLSLFPGIFFQYLYFSLINFLIWFRTPIRECPGTNNSVNLYMDVRTLSSSRHSQTSINVTFEKYVSALYVDASSWCFWLIARLRTLAHGKGMCIERAGKYIPDFNSCSIFQLLSRDHFLTLSPDHVLDMTAHYPFFMVIFRVKFMS